MAFIVVYWANKSAGSGCTTLLKTISGEMSGLNIEDNAYINYQGKPISTTGVANIDPDHAAKQSFTSMLPHLLDVDGD